MLIDSNELHAKLYKLGQAIRKSDLLFSEYKILIDLLQTVHDLIDGLEVDAAGEKILKRYSKAIEGLADK